MDMYAAKVRYAASANSIKAKSCTFTTYDEKLENVEVFKYLGHLVSLDNNNIQAIWGNLKKVRKTWAQLS